MGEPASNPSNAYIEKARTLYTDPLLVWATNKAVESLNQLSNENISEYVDKTRTKLFKNELILFIQNFGVGWVMQEVYGAVEDLGKTTNERLKGMDFTIQEKKSNNIDSDVTNTKLRISQVAKKYGLDVVNKRCACPFHSGENKTSLSLNDEKNIFYCFSCGSKGDIFTFIKMLENLKKNG